VVDELDCPVGVYEAKVDDKLRLKMPIRFQEVLAKVDIRAWFIVSLDGVTVSLYPAAEWAKTTEEILERDEDGHSLIAFAEQEGIAYEMSPEGRILLPPQSPCCRGLRNQRVWLLWQENQILILSCVPGDANAICG
jgi:DNA-binding transcriptional regulator/RsmH inhibitor MraZ